MSKAGIIYSGERMSNDQRQRRKRNERQPTRLALNERDKAIIEAVHNYRVLSQTHIQALFFGPDNQSGCQRRLVKLYDAGYVERKFVGPVINRSPILYILDKKGAELLRAERGYEDLTWHSSDKALKTDFLEHTLAIADFRIAMTLACRQHDYTIPQWVGEQAVKADYDRVMVTMPNGKRESIAVVPDSYFSIRMGNRHYPFFLELDRGTMALPRFKTKIQAYLAY